MDNENKTVEYALDSFKKHTIEEMNEIVDELLKRSSSSMSRMQLKLKKQKETP